MGRQPFRGVGIQERALRGARIIGDNAGIAVVMDAGKSKGSVNQIRSEAFPRGAIRRRYAQCRIVFAH